MKIKLAILDNDINYLKRLVSVFSTKMSDKLQVVSYTDKQIAMDNLKKEKIDVFLSSDTYEIDQQLLPPRCGFAFLVDRLGVDSINEVPAVFKFQKTELIYRQILSIYSEKSTNISGGKMSGDGGKLLVFSSPCGGTGTTSAAVACAMWMSSTGNRVFYLNLESFGSSDLYLSADGQYGLSDVIYAIKSRKANLGIKLESCVKRDISGVSFFSGVKFSLDMLELKMNEIRQMIIELKNTSLYDYIIVDIQFTMDKEKISLFEDADTIVFVSDCKENANYKIRRAYEAITTMEQGVDWYISGKIAIIYNKYSNNGLTIDDVEINNVGALPYFQNNGSRSVAEQMSKYAMFNQLR